MARPKRRQQPKRKAKPDNLKNVQKENRGGSSQLAPVAKKPRVEPSPPKKKGIVKGKAPMSITLPNQTTVAVMVAPDGSFDDSKFSPLVSRQIRNHIARHLVWPPPGITIRNYRVKTPSPDNESPKPSTFNTLTEPGQFARSGRHRTVSTPSALAYHRHKYFEGKFLREKEEKERKKRKGALSPTKKMRDSAERKYTKWMVNSFDKKGFKRPQLSLKNHVRLYRLIYTDAEREAVLGTEANTYKEKTKKINLKKRGKGTKKKRSGWLSWLGL